MPDVWSYLQDIKQQQAEERQKQLAESQNIAEQQRLGTLMGGLSESAAQVGTIGGQQAKSTLGDFNNQITRATADEYARNQAARKPDQMIDMKVIEHLAKQKEVKPAEWKLASDYSTNNGAPAFYRTTQTGGIEYTPGAQRYVKPDSEKEKEPKDIQLQAAGFGKRAIAADQIVADLMQGGYDPSSLGTQVRSHIPFISNWTKSNEDQRMEQAQRDFVTAVLRKESGANIPEPEMKGEVIKYFPQAGNTPDVLAQKAASRKRAIETLKAEAGHGWGNVKDIAAAKVSQPPQSSGTAQGAPAAKPKQIKQNGHVYILNEQTGEYE
jgi:hypothetical protein